MSIEKVTEVDPSVQLKKNALHQGDRGNSTPMIAKDSDNDGFMSLDELKLKNKVKDQVLGDADLDGDGIVSPKEQVIKGNSTENMEYDLSYAQENAAKLLGMLTGQVGIDTPAQRMLEVMHKCGTGQANDEKLQSLLQSEDDLNLLA
ncbi:MAG: hypothetical protein K9N55_05125 [Phycisphaerae bacterium]|nr:hypothetical protein [Phycisphaerae bacterium]